MNDRFEHIYWAEDKDPSTRGEKLVIKRISNLYSFAIHDEYGGIIQSVRIDPKDAKAIIEQLQYSLEQHKD